MDEASWSYKRDTGEVWARMRHGGGYFGASVGIRSSEYTGLNALKNMLFHKHRGMMEF